MGRPPGGDDGNLEVTIGRALLAQSRDCVMLLHVDGSLRFLNEAGRCLLEIEPSNVPLNQPWAGFWPEEVKPLANAAISKAARGEVDRFSAYAPTVLGTPKWWDVVVAPFGGADGAIDGVLCVSRDITQEKLSESALRAGEQRFRGLADNMAQLAWMADREGQVFWYNKRWLDYAGVNEVDAIKGGWHALHHPDFADRLKERMTGAFERLEMWEEQIPLRSADGSYRWFLSRAVPVVDDSGRVALWCATLTDISEQRNLSHRLRQLARVVELSHEAILVWDLEDGIALWNNGCEELYGFTRAEALGQRSHELLSTDHDVGVEVFEANLRRTGEWSGEIRHRAKDGSEIWVDSRQELIRAGGRDLVIETNRDITERRKSDELRDMLLAELNHRVKNTLAVVQSIAAQMARSETSLPEFMTRFSSRIQSLAISQSILSDAQWSGAELSDLIRSQVSLISPGSEHVRLDGVPVMVPPELALQLTLVIHELASNASRHGALARPGGMVRVKWEEAPDLQSGLVIDWRESGGPPVTASSGYGFGRRLIERTGRLPHLKTELQLLPEGARCRIVLDFAKLNAPARGYFKPGRLVAAASATPASMRPARMAGRRILLIEEDPLETMWLEDVLSDAGFLIVGVARTMEVALRQIEARNFDLAIVDRTGQALDADPLLKRLADLDKRSLSLVASIDASPTEPALAKPLEARSLIAALQSGRDR